MASERNSQPHHSISGASPPNRPQIGGLSFICKRIVSTFAFAASESALHSSHISIMDKQMSSLGRIDVHGMIESTTIEIQTQANGALSVEWALQFKGDLKSFMLIRWCQQPS